MAGWRTPGGRHPAHLRSRNGLLARARRRGRTPPIRPLPVHAGRHTRRLRRTGTPNSTALICPRGDLPRPQTAAALKATDGYTSLLGLISHEYFHTWNVKRLRPAEFATYDLDRENHTGLLWFFEGFTSYYDDLLLHRAGLIDTASYLQLLAKTTNQVAQTPGRQVQTVAQASFDAWTRYYRIQENTPNATVSYYTKVRWWLCASTSSCASTTAAWTTPCAPCGTAARAAP